MIVKSLLSEREQEMQMLEGTEPMPIRETTTRTKEASSSNMFHENVVMPLGHRTHPQEKNEHYPLGKWLTGRNVYGAILVEYTASKYACVDA